ncbi:unnamed protein product [Urochloa decumbens]|uniref:F-box domain-containing protein n=1 Tax=Urochloa decumbens TaxID=240449 RepID=A0ABC9BT95_9POAL
MARRRRLLPNSAAPAPALDGDDTMSEILLRLPPLPSSLPRASLVCKRWRRLVSDPHFVRRFREHHRKPPVLGFISQLVAFSSQRVSATFTSVLDSPDNIPAERFSLHLENDIRCKMFDCRHGRVLFLDQLAYFLVWAPVTGEQHRVGFPLSLRKKEMMWEMNGAVVCAASEQGHVHGSCHSDPFQVVLLRIGRHGILACVYSSETCAWGNAVSLLWPQNIRGVYRNCPNTLVGNSVCWFLIGRRFGILKFDLRSQSLSAIELPSDAVEAPYFWINYQFLITPADDGGINFLCLSGFSAQVWKWKASCDVGAGWRLGSKIDLNNLLSLDAGVDTRPPQILGLAEDDNTMFLVTDVGVFMLHLKTMQFKKLSIRMSYGNCICYPFRSFYSADGCTDRG